MFTHKQLRIELEKQLAKMLIALLLTAVAIYFFGSQVSQMSKAAKEQRTAVFILEQRNQTSNMLQEGFKLIGEGDKNLENAFIEVENITEFIVALEKLSRTNGTAQVLQFGIPAPFIIPNENEIKENGLNILKIEYTIILEGNSKLLVDYLKDFEVLPYFTGASSVNAASSAKGWQENAKIQLRSILYASGNE